MERYSDFKSGNITLSLKTDFDDVYNLPDIEYSVISNIFLLRN
jgi:hypothetical protein